jgi:transcriptional regulator with XRE-family HTH domain
MTLADRLKEARKSARLTQKGVAARTPFTDTTISNWENGVSRPDVDSLAILCRLYKVNPNDILEWTYESISIDEEPLYSAEIDSIVNELHANPELRTLLDASAKLDKESLEEVTALVRKIKGTEAE